MEAAAAYQGEGEGDAETRGACVEDTPAEGPASAYEGEGHKESLEDMVQELAPDTHEGA